MVEASANIIQNNKSNTIRSEILFVTIVFIISPFLCFPLLLIGAYNHRKYVYIYISVFMGLLSMYYFPQGDQYRYMGDLLLYKTLPFSKLFNYEAIITYRNFNLITLTLFWAAKSQFISLEIYRMLIVSCGCGIILYLYNNNSKNLLGTKEGSFQFKLFLIVLLSTPFYYMSQGFRSGFGAVFLCAGIYKCLHYKKIGYGFILIASFIHFSYLPLSLLYLIAMKCKIRITNKNLLYFLTIFIIIFVLSIYILYNRNPFITMLLDIYVFGDYGFDFKWDAYRFKEIFFINGLPTILLYTIFLFSRKERVDYRFSNILYLNLAILIAFLPFQAFIQRLCIISVLLLAFYSIIYYKSMKLKKYAQIVLITLMVSNLYPFFMHRYCYFHSNIENFFLYPLPLILQNTYHISEVNILVDETGVLKPQYLK